ncbi:MAG: TraE/TraK family type IV conjugative transfer system protein [Nitrospiria bacterium]
MLFKKFISSWENDRLEKRFYQMLTFGLTLALTFSVYGIISVSKTTRVILMPAALEKSVWVSGEDASNEYFAQMANFFANFRLTYTPQTVDYEFANLLKYVTPEASGILQAELKNIALDVKGKNYAQTFIPMEVSVVDPKTHTYLIKGSERHFVGSQMVEEIVKEYQVTFVLINGKIYVSAFKDVQKPGTAESR